MHIQWLKIELLSDLVVSRFSATTGGHETLDYIPGATLIGALAADGGYQHFGHDIFWSGKVRFGNGLPLCQNRLAFPMPLCFHRQKTNPDQFCNLAISNLPDDVQYQQMRHGYITIDGAYTAPKTNYRLKTAVDRSRFGASHDAQLFGYQSLCQGQCFISGIQADNSVKMDVFNEILRRLTTPGIRLGRSRSAEYGKVRISLLEEPPVLPTTMQHDSRIILYLASDFAPNSDGMPSLTPNPSWFDLKGYSYNPEKSFVRCRSYWPWNQFINRPDTEKQVLVAGSVLTFDPMKDATPVNPADLQRQLAASCGFFTQEGLGQIWVNPDFVIKCNTSPKSAVSAPESIIRSCEKPLHPLIQYVSEKASMARGETEAIKAGRQWADEIRKVLKVRTKMGERCPGRSQWSAIRNLAATCTYNKTELRNKLAAFCTGSLRRQCWVQAAQEKNNLLKFIDGKLSNCPDAIAGRTLYHASIELYRWLGREENETLR